MSWNEIIKIVFSVLVSIGGIGGIIILVVKFASDIIAKRLVEKYKVELNKELENYKSNLNNKTYISKTRFNAEFKIYRELSKTFFKMIKEINSMIPSGLSYKLSDEKKEEEREEMIYSNAKKSTILAQDVLNSNSAFISEDLYEKHEDILKLCRQQLRAFERRYDELYIASQEEKKRFSTKDYQCTDKINEKFKKINQDIRKYLSSLDVLE